MKEAWMNDMFLNIHRELHGSQHPQGDRRNPHPQILCSPGALGLETGVKVFHPMKLPQLGTWGCGTHVLLVHFQLQGQVGQNWLWSLAHFLALASRDSGLCTASIPAPHRGVARKMGTKQANSNWGGGGRMPQTFDSPSVLAC